MKKLSIKNPFNAPVYYKEFADSTMDISKELALKGEPSGTVIMADYQDRGRGRIENRIWEADKGESLLFTIKLTYSKLPTAITLRTGLALIESIEDSFPVLKELIKIKWPNDIMLPEQERISIVYKKVAGILTLADNYNIHIGIGINFMQKAFSNYLKNKATSITLSIRNEIKESDRFLLMGLILDNLYKELNCNEENTYWKERIEERLYKNGEKVVFLSKRK